MRRYRENGRDKRILYVHINRNIHIKNCISVRMHNEILSDLNLGWDPSGLDGGVYGFPELGKTIIVP
jgi:hypothetical protein